MSSDDPLDNLENFGGLIVADALCGHDFGDRNCGVPNVKLPSEKLKRVRVAQAELDRRDELLKLVPQEVHITDGRDWMLVAGQIAYVASRPAAVLQMDWQLERGTIPGPEAIARLAGELCSYLRGEDADWIQKNTRLCRVAVTVDVITLKRLAS